LLATNSTAVAGSDENRLQLLNTIGFAAAQIAGAEGVEFDLNELSHVGRISSPPMAVAVGADSDIQSFDDIIEATEPVRFVATGPGSDGYVFATGLAEAYDFPYEVITGFAGSGEARNALVAGNADAMALAFDSLLGAVESGEVRSVLLVAEEGHEWMPDAPPSAEFEPAGEGGQALLESLIALGATGRSVAGPPGMPEDRLAEAREAFECALSNEELLSEMESQQRPVDYLGGDEYAEQVQQVLDASPEFEAAIKASF
jgi:tripartite-type tricarboxylate transporter receptor subunit TctC